MGSLDTIISGGLLTAGGTGILLVIGLFIRRLIATTTKEAARSGAEVDILNMWKVERDTLKSLTEELQRERVELMVKLSSVQSQLSFVQEQLSILVKDKKTLEDELKQRYAKCEDCIYRPK